MIKKQGGSLRESYLEEGFILEKSIGVGQPKRIENANILVANTSMDTDKIKVGVLQDASAGTAMFIFQFECNRSMGLECVCPT